MTDLLLRDIDPQLAARIRKVAETNGWTMHDTILHLIERGLFASEGGALRFDGSESDVIQSAIAALETVPNDPGFSLIGRVGRSEEPAFEAAPTLSERDLMHELDAAAARVVAGKQKP
jgi:hypothetical protein